MNRSLVGRHGSFRSALALALVVATAVSPLSAFAVSNFDPAPVLQIVADAILFIVAIGVAVLGLIFTARGFKWARKAG